MTETYGIHDVSVRPIVSGGARLSIPVRIVGIDKEANEVRFFGKIVGSADSISASTIHLFKNLFLESGGLEPLFRVGDSAEQMVRHQHETVEAIRSAGVPTARSYGYYHLDQDVWIVISEYIVGLPLSITRSITDEQMDDVFGYVQRMHRAGVYHGDIKAENILIGDRIYFVDVGDFADSSTKEQKEAYDLASLTGSLSEFRSPESVVATARRHFSPKALAEATQYLDLVQTRPDTSFANEIKEKLMRLMRR